MMDAIELLMEEHQNILALTRVMETMCRRIAGGEEPVPADFHTAIRLIREYADKLHHGKEEEILFKSMTDTLGEPAKQLVNHGMMVEHDLARLYVKNMEEATRRYEQEASLEAKTAMGGYAFAYLELLRRHIDKEDVVAYTFARRALSQEEQKKVQNAFDQKIADSALTAELVQQLGTLREKYGV